ncbi:hypothetical protein HJC23_004467 [Cyclotella cryptica]|uniref:Uncharacterized protein n=1 Tax=Cyclotella cryptica TaxID=29204 RepID=A0ABD3QG17_9STRA|eukprot:CCRYP_006087-RA/>CCRYP_006087-RA protein AED:0.05 eAED:0.05 QI:255/-1/1/1/-1/1/1/273/398
MLSSPLRVSALATALFLLADDAESFSSQTSPLLRLPPASLPSTALHAKESPTESDAEIRDRILQQIDSGLRSMTGFENYGDPEEEFVDEEDDDGAIDAATLGQWDERDLRDKFEYEWDPEKGEEDPNNLDPQFEYFDEVMLDDEGIEVGYDPLYGVSNPFDERTILNPPDSYVIDERTRDDRLVTPEFREGDPEKEINDQITSFRKSLKILETHIDPFLNQEVPSHTAKWHGYPEQLSFPEQDYHNNRFTKPEDRTDFDALGPAKARVVAVQMARKKNNEWLPEGVSAEYHRRKTAVYKEKGILTGSTLPGKADPEVVAKIRPALEVLGDVVELLSIEAETVFRFKYHGLIKNKRGMEAWAGVLIRNCDVDCTGVVFETGFRKRDPWYDGGSHWYGPY